MEGGEEVKEKPAKKGKKGKKDKPDKAPKKKLTPEEKAAKKEAALEREREMGQKYESFQRENLKLFSGELIMNFNHLFMFSAFCIILTAARAPVDFAVSLSYAIVLSHIALAYACYMKKNLLRFSFYGLQFVCNFLLICLSRFNKYD